MTALQRFWTGMEGWLRQIVNSKKDIDTSEIILFLHMPCYCKEFMFFSCFRNTSLQQKYCILGSSDFDKFSKIAMLLVVLDWKIISKTILEKAFYLYCIFFF